MNLTNEEIFDGNKLIADFTGYFDYMIEFCKRQNIPYDWEKDIVEIQSLKYHDSWELMMPVIDIINGMGKEYSFAIFKTYVSLTVEKGGKVYKDFSFAYSEYITADQTGKEATFKLIVKFIKWYNECNKK